MAYHISEARCPTLTSEQVAALQGFAAYAGRTWKAQILQAWMYQSIPGHIAALRNSHGPSWLKTYRLPVAPKA
jgi:hypothetical protein